MPKKDILNKPKKSVKVTSLKTAEIVAYAALNKKALSPVILNSNSEIADYFVVVSGNTNIQVRAIVTEIERICSEEKIVINHIEGEKAGTWVLIDLGDVMVHVFTKDQRDYYGLEKLWKQGKHIELPKL